MLPVHANPNRMLPFKATSGQRQINSIVGIIAGQTPAADLLKMERGAAFIFLNSPNEMQSCKSSECFRHGFALPFCDAVKRTIPDIVRAYREHARRVLAPGDPE